MAYPGEKEHIEYTDYLLRQDLGEEEGPRLSKEDWLKKRQQAQPALSPQTQPQPKGFDLMRTLFGPKDAKPRL